MLLVAGLVAAVKLGELVRIEAGAGAVAFVACIGLTMFAGATCRDVEQHAGWANDSDVDAGPVSRGDREATKGIA